MAADLTATPGNPASYKGSRAVVRHPNYTVHNGRPVDRGQVVLLRGQENDDRNIRLGFTVLLEKGVETASCGVCGCTFATIKGEGGGSAMKFRNAHGWARHESRDKAPEPLAPRLSDVDQVDENTQMGTEPDNDPGEAKDAPQLYLDRTAANLGVKPDSQSLPITL
jgi:hypothetical protein